MTASHQGNNEIILRSTAAQRIFGRLFVGAYNVVFSSMQEEQPH
jgi:hypothetical protein